MIQDNIIAVEEKIRKSCERAGRDPKEVTLICVSKTKPMEMIQEAYEYGKRAFGENKAQEMRDKHDALPQDIEWHFIGHLQTNKVKYVVGRAALIHSVDSIRLAEAIEAESAKKDVISHVLIEVNVAQEDSKFGVKPEETLELIEKIADFPHIQIDGLMTIAPFVENPEENRPIFRQLKQLLVDINAKNTHNINMYVLSMGMTNDYEVAIEEGASYVRVGTGIFGARQYQI